MFQENIDAQKQRIRDLQKTIGLLEDDLARVHAELVTEKRGRAAVGKAHEALAAKYESLQTRHAAATAQASSSASRVNSLLVEQGELEELREQVAQQKAELADASVAAFASKAEALAATRLHAAEVARANRFESEREEAVAATVRAEAAAREALNRLAQSEGIQAEQAQKLAEQDRLLEAFIVRNNSN